MSFRHKSGTLNKRTLPRLTAGQGSPLNIGTPFEINTDSPITGNQLLFDGFFLRLTHTLADFILYRVFSAVEFTDTFAQTAHEFRYFLTSEQQQHYQENKYKFRSAEVAEE